MSNLVDKAIELQVMTCLDSLLDRANHDEYLQRIGKKEALRFLEENVKYSDIIKSALIKAEKEHKALEIIKEKECDMRWLKYCIKGNAEVETYNNGLPEYYEKLTEEEFNLLKEVLG